jgi:hypothetical protein
MKMLRITKLGFSSLSNSLQKMIIKTLYYPTTSREEEILAHLLIKNAIDKRSAVLLSEGKLVKKLEKAEQIAKTENGKYYLIDVGLVVAKGATELYPELKSI